MTQIFISYAREDETRILPLVRALENQGWSVFWDRRIPAGQTWRSYIGNALNDASCVIVIWSQHSIASSWVSEEAEIGKRRGNLVPVLLDSVEPPIGFRSIQAADLTAWLPGNSSSHFEQLLHDINTTLTLTSTPANTKLLAGSGYSIPKQRESKAMSRPLIYTLISMFFVLILGGIYLQQLSDVNNGLGNNEQNEAKKIETGVKNKELSSTQSLKVVSTELNDSDTRMVDNLPSSVAGAGTERINLLSSENGGQILVATSDKWLTTIDGKKEGITFNINDTEAVYAFKDEQTAVFDTFTVLIDYTFIYNLKDFELLWGNESATGKFYPIGKFETKNMKLFKTPYQEFKFPPVTARYLKVRLLSTWDGGMANMRIQEFQLWGTLQ
ncbi:toll/interleukin-1 receptor domain-containing protein [Nitrosomonas nitrosa]|uniref:toll/interleukin-1 receptor domain-containing protein n=1 Tax=Nitrosomonas nitrosa TaxID=52442 RepID=UPI0023F791E8|nr:toll/interleukin-1 receptor domain-containing protein [Nitrosomonas nitrosa]MCO6434454.1 toll/interleukin-1 receptor domain-containing protein [Nitrosomonas nitrosa]